jgi:CheY-like chemotaxis protein
MRVEVRCHACARRYLLDAVFAGSVLPCPTCGATDGLRVPAAKRAVEPARVDDTAPQMPVSRPSLAIDDTAPQRRVATPTPSAPEPVEQEVVCPRCKLHFSPGRSEPSVDETVRRTVLVVDDQELFRDIAWDALAPRFEVKAAADLAGARAHLASGPVDLIVLDPKLEHGESGIELLRDLPGVHCPVVIYSDQDESEAYGESWERLRRLGADDLVVKGLHSGESLARKVRELLGERWTEDE